jgi:hypothetical protein
VADAGEAVNGRQAIQALRLAWREDPVLGAPDDFRRHGEIGDQFRNAERLGVVGTQRLDEAGLRLEKGAVATLAQGRLERRRPERGRICDQKTHP